LRDCTTAEEVLKAEKLPLILPTELEQDDRRELDDAVFELLGVSNEKRRKGLIDRLYREMAMHTRAVRVVEVQKMEQRRHGAATQTVSQLEVALDAWRALDSEWQEPLSQWLEENSHCPKTVNLPDGTVRLPHPHNFFEATTIYFGRKPALNHVCASRAEAELLAVIATEGLRGPVSVPSAEKDCLRLKTALETRLEKHVLCSRNWLRTGRVPMIFVSTLWAHCTNGSSTARRMAGTPLFLQRPYLPTKGLAPRASADCSRRSTVIEFFVKNEDFRKAVRLILAGSREFMDTDTADLNVRGEIIELQTTGTSTDLPAEVVAAGYARVPLPTLKEVNRIARSFATPRIRVRIEPGKFRVESFCLSNSAIELRSIGARIADLPVDAPAADALALLKLYSADELGDSGLAARVMLAQQFATARIDSAHAPLQELGVTRDELLKLVDQHVASRAKVLKTVGGGGA
jgi:hypothetical protein